MSKADGEHQSDSDDSQSDNNHRRKSRRTTGRKLLLWLSEITKSTSLFQGILSQANPTQRSKIQLPWEFATAWLYVLTALVPYSEADYRTEEAFDEQSQICDRLMNQGMREVTQSITKKSLRDYLVLKPRGLVSLMNLELLGDIAPPQLDITETYLTYLRQLVSF